MEEVLITIGKMLKRRGHEPESHHWNMAAQGGYQGKTRALRVALKLRDRSFSSEVASNVGDRLKEGFGESCSLDTSDEDQGIWKEGPWEKGVYQRKVRARILSPPCLPTKTRVSAPGS